MSSSKQSGEKKGDGLEWLVNHLKSIFRKAKPKQDAPAPVTGGADQPAIAETPEATSVPLQRRLDARALVQREKAQALFAKYGLELNDDEWYVSSVHPVQRVEKPIRMRVRRQCHRCQATFGHNKICSKCDHPRCKYCPRIPPKKNKDKRKAVTEGQESGSKDSERREARSTGDTSSPGGEELMRRPVKQKVRRFCHKCNTLFEGKATQCAECKHTRCKLCPRDPPKGENWKEGYSGDAESETEEDPTADPSSTEEEKKDMGTEPSLLKTTQDKISTLGIQGDEPGGQSS